LDRFATRELLAGGVGRRVLLQYDGDPVVKGEWVGLCGESIQLPPTDSANLGLIGDEVEQRRPNGVWRVGHGRGSDTGRTGQAGGFRGKKRSSVHNMGIPPLHPDRVSRP
jgi:hypothetical protein